MALSSVALLVWNLAEQLALMMAASMVDWLVVLKVCYLVATLVETSD